MSHQYQPTSYYDWPARKHGIFLDSGSYVYVPYDYYSGDEIHQQNVVFKDSQYVTFDNTHLRFLNRSDLHLYDTSGIVIHDSGTLVMYTSASPFARKFVVDEIGRVGIGMDHGQPHANRGESPSFDLDVRGQVGVEDYIYHNDDVDTYMLFGSDLSAHYVNTVGEIHDIYPADQGEINFRVGGIDMLQMQSRDVDHVESGVKPIHTQDHVTFNKYQTDVDFVVRSETNTGAFVVSGDGAEVVINEDGNADTDFRVESDHEDHMLFVDTSVNRISIGDSEDTPQATLEVTNDPVSGAFDVPLVQLNNEDTDKQLLDINAKNIDADVISVSADDLVSADVVSVTADSLTTGDVFNATADSLTTGSLIHMTHTGSDKSEVSLVHLESTGDRGDDTNSTVLLDLNFDTTDGTAARTVRIDTEQTTGTAVEVDASEITTGRVLAIDADGLTGGKGIELLMGTRTTGTGLHVYDSHGSDHGGNLIKFEQAGDRSGDQSSTLLNLNLDTTNNPNSRALYIDSEQRDGTVVEIDATPLTTGKGLHMHMDSRTTGSGLHIHDASTTDSAGALVKIEQAGDRDGTQASIGLDINFDTTANPAARALRIDSEQTTGTVVEVDAQRVTTGTAMTVSASDMTTGTGLEIGFDSRTTGTGMNVKDTHTSDDAGTLMLIQQYGDRAGSAASIGVDIDFNTTSNANARAFRIDSEQTTGVVAEIDANKITTGTALDISGVDDLITGTIANLHSNSGDTGNRDLVKIMNDNTAATGARLLHIKNDAIASGSKESIRFESTAADKNPLLELRNSNAAHDTPALLNFKRSSNNPAKDMDLGTITFEGDDSNHADTVYAAISARATDIQQNEASGVLNFMVQATDGGPAQLRNMLSIGGQVNTTEPQGVGTQAEVVVNEDSIDLDFRVESTTTASAFIVYGDGSEVVVNENGRGDTDFRVESDDETHMLFVDTSVNRISIGDSEDTPAATLEVTNNSGSGAYNVPLVQLNNEDTDKQLLDINAKNINADVINVHADDLTTGDVLNTTADKLTTGSLIHMTHTGNSNASTSLVHFESTGDRGHDSNQTVLLDLNFDTTAGTGARAFRIDSEQTTGTVVEVDAQRVTTGTAMTVSASDMTTGTGLEIGFDSRTTGTGVHIVDTHNSDSAGSLVKIEQDGNRTGTQASIGLDINFDTTVNPNARAFKIDSEQRDGVVAEIDASMVNTGKGLHMHMDNRTTGTGLHIHDASTTDSAGALVKIEQAGDRDGTQASIGLDINFDTTANPAARALRIDSEQTTGRVVEIDAHEITTGDAFAVVANGLTTGAILDLDSNSNSTSARSLVKIKNDHVSATGTTLLHLTNDAKVSGGHKAVALIESTATETSPLLELRNTNNALDAPPLLNFKNLNYAGGSADVDLGTITFEGQKSSTSARVVYAALSARATDIETNNFGGVLNFMVQATDSPSQLRNMLSIGGQTNTTQTPDTQAEVVINEDQIDLDFRVESNTTNNAFIVYGDGAEVVVNENGASDTDFRVESNKCAKMLWVDASTDSVLISGAGGDDTDIFNIQGNSDSSTPGANLLRVSPTTITVNEDSNDVNFRVESNTNTHAFLIKGNGSEVVVNDTGQADTDFRVESDNSTKMLYVDTENEIVEIRGPANDDTDIFLIAGTGDNEGAGHELLAISPTDTVFNDDSNDVDFRIESNTNTHAFYVDGGGSEVVINDQGLADTDFRVESNVSPASATDGLTSDHIAHDKTHAFFVNTSTGKVGLGTSDPQTTLHVAGSAQIEGDLWVKGVTNRIDTLVHVTSAMEIINRGTGPALKVTQTGTNPVAEFYDDTFPALVIENGNASGPGNVGIGTNNPAADLHLSKASTINEDNILRITSLHNSADPVFQMFGQNDNHGEGFELWYDNSTGAAHMATLNTSEASDLIFHTKVNSKSTSNERLRIESAGNIGINQSTPWTKLYIESTDGVRVPVGTTSQRPTSGAFGLTGTKLLGDGTENTVNANRMLGTIRYNTEQSTFEGFGPGYKWGSLGGVIDVDRDTYWTAVNDLENTHTDEFDSPTANNEYPGDTDYLRAFTSGLKRFAISNDGDSRWYFKTSGGGTTTSPYVYSNMLQIQPKTTGVNIHSQAAGKSIDMSTKDIPGTSGSACGDITIVGGSALDRTTTGGGGAGADISITAGSGGDRKTSGNGGKGGDVTLTSGEQGAGGTAGARGKITLNSKGAVDVDAVDGFSVDATGISLDSDAASNFTTSTGELTFSGGSGVTINGTGQEIDITSTGGKIDMNAGSLDVDTTGGVTIDATGISLDSDAASNFTTSSGALTLSGTGGLVIDGNGQEIDITTSGNGAIDMNAGNLDVDTTGGVTIDATGISLDSDAASNFTTSSGALTFSGAGGLVIDGTGQEIDITTTGAAIDMNAGSLDVDTTGGVTIDATGISLDSDAASNFTTSSGALTFSGGSGVTINGTGQEIDITTTGAAIDMNAGSLDVDTTGGVTIDATGISLDSDAASNFTTSSGALTLSGAGGLVIDGTSEGVNLISGTDFTMKNSATTPAVMFSVAGETGALTAKSISATSLSLGTDLAVSNGGTGVSSLADKSVCVTQASGTDKVLTKVMTTDGALLIGGSDGPEASTLTAGTDITITNAKNAITINHDSTGAATNPTVTATARTFVKSITVDANGHVTGIGTGSEDTTSTKTTLDLDTDNRVQFRSLGIGIAASTTTGTINATGDIVAFASSDKRLKENLTPISDPIDKLSKINGYEFDWIENDEVCFSGHDIGVLAQEIESVLPEIVTTRDSGYKAVKYEKLTALLIEVTKSQQAQIDELTRKVEQLSK